MSDEQPVQEAAWDATGLRDDLRPASRARGVALLAWLTDEGCSVEEMVEAHAGRLFALAGDRVVRPPGRRRSVAEAAAALDAAEDDVDRAWQALGLADPGATELEDDDLPAVRHGAGRRRPP